MGYAVFIYVLCDPDTDDVHYVGKSFSPKQRMAQHLYSANVAPGARQQPVLQAWIKELRSRGKSPVMKVVGVTTESDANELELSYIKYYSNLYELKNTMLMTAKSGWRTITEEEIKEGQKEYKEMLMREKANLEEHNKRRGEYIRNQTFTLMIHTERGRNQSTKQYLSDLASAMGHSNISETIAWLAMFTPEDVAKALATLPEKMGHEDKSSH